MKNFLLILTVLFLVGCSDSAATSGLLSRPKDSTPPVAGEAYVDLQGNPVQAGTPLLPEDTSPVDKVAVQPTTETTRPATSFPDDTTEGIVDQTELKQAFITKDPGRFVGLPTGLSENGYPVYPATCSFYPDHAECELLSGEVVDEAYLEQHTTVIRNIDVLHGDMTCGTMICVDKDGNVLGHVSKAMQGWRSNNCTWRQYGDAICK
ncbi:hypothetical protein LUCX_39 [Xanthomonas phage vB_XciM_LucasX]|nr:hypothetical protein LUCX_39 [Xanthomonas phage vB_XciM_LucasX]